MNHDYNRSLEDYVSTNIMPVHNHVCKGTMPLQSFDIPQVEITITGLPAHLFATTNLAEFLHKNMYTLTNKFAKTACPHPTCTISYSVDAVEYVDTFIPTDRRFDPELARMKQQLLQNLKYDDTSQITVCVRCPFHRVASVYEFLQASISRYYKTNRKIQQDYEAYPLF